jgi:hypothetical protein
VYEEEPDSYGERDRYGDNDAVDGARSNSRLSDGYDSGGRSPGDEIDGRRSPPRNFRRSPSDDGDDRYDDKYADKYGDAKKPAISIPKPRAVKQEPTQPPAKAEEDTRNEKQAAGGEKKLQALERRRARNAARHAAGLTPVIFNGLEIPLILRELHEFLKLPVRGGLGTQVRCFIERSRSGTNKLAPVYTLYADHEDGSGRLLLCAKKMLQSRESHYVISTNMDDLYRKREVRSRHFMGKLRGNAAGTDYTLYDNGVSPKELGVCSDTESDENDENDNGKSKKKEGSTKGLTQNQLDSLRKELCCIHYNHDKKNKIERKMEVALPACWEEERPSGEKGGGMEIEVDISEWRPVLERDSLAANFTRVRYQRGQNSLLANKIHTLHWRESRYDPLSSCLVDFKERANTGSVKNFQLVKSWPEDPKQLPIFHGETGLGYGEPEKKDATMPVLLQMGKVGKNCFNMDFQYPLSMLQAFAICLSRFDTNLSW